MLIYLTAAIGAVFFAAPEGISLHLFGSDISDEGEIPAASSQDSCQTAPASCHFEEKHPFSPRIASPALRAARRDRPTASPNPQDS